MDASLNCCEIGKGITFCSVRDKRFKTNRISVNLVTALSEDTVTVNALIPQILKDGFAGCEDFTTLRRRLENLYGAWCDGDVQKRGDRQILTLHITALDDRFSLDGEPINRKAAEILSDMVLCPLVEGDGFSAKYTELEKSSLRDTIQAEINEKRSYAINRMLRKMCADEPYGLPKYGFEKQLAAITPQSVYEQYRTLLRDARIYVFFVGCGDAEPVRAAFEAVFSKQKRSECADSPAAPHLRLDAPVKEETERMELSQSKMVFGFSGGVGPSDERFPAMRLMTAVLGGTPSSKFFVNVREKMSLCYYCSAMLDSSKGVLVADCGVEKRNIETARKEILAQLAAIQRGDVSEKEIDSARLSLQNAFATVYENDVSIESFYLGQLLNGLRSSPEAERKKLGRVSIPDLAEAAKLFALDTVFLLTGKEES